MPPAGFRWRPSPGPFSARYGGLFIFSSGMRSSPEEAKDRSRGAEPAHRRLAGKGQRHKADRSVVEAPSGTSSYSPPARRREPEIIVAKRPDEPQRNG
ncbi:hypothetical protein TR75_00275 [Hydrogenibacillus schlegelii]|nr:hypothetical protein TR75_00275 [Hydrogenibacillus schlegelii]